jgi:hypothetical protein
MEQTTWQLELEKAMTKAGESGKEIVGCTLTQQELDVKFPVDYGAPHGKSFTLWTANRVYFPVAVNGLEWVESVPRYPNNEPTYHVG